tara:strand:- start:2561 stop:2833 length:273 start_codon:yes stop_codon:yes gene_type:complete
MEIKLQGGKYTYVFDEQTGRQEVLRHDELWRDLCGDNFTLAMAQHIEALQAAVVEAHRIILHEMDNGRTPTMLKAEHGGKGLGYFEDLIK